MDKEYIKIKVCILEDERIIPFWDEEINYNGNLCFYKNERINRFIDAFFNLKTKEIKISEPLNYYISLEELQFKVNDTILYKIDYLFLEETKIIDIQYKKDKFRVFTGEEIKYTPDLIEYFKDKKIDNNSLYFIYYWIPYYILSNGVETEHIYNFFKIKE